jgi:hypothetical protein
VVGLGGACIDVSAADAQVHEHGGDAAAGLVDLDALDQGTDQAAAVLGGYEVPDGVEVGEGLCNPLGVGLGFRVPKFIRLAA